MSTKGAKGKGKSRGSGPSSQRRSRSRNTTPAGSVFSVDTAVSSGRQTYQELIEYYNINELAPIPTVAQLSQMKESLKAFNENAKNAARAADRGLRILSNKMTEWADRDARIREEERASEVAKEKEKGINKKKSKKGSERPLAIGAHQATGQSVSTDGVLKAEKKRKGKPMESPDVKRRTLSPEASRSSAEEHQPAPAGPSYVYESLPDDPAVYEIAHKTAADPIEERKAAYSVAGFPPDDLSSLIPGDPPDEDFSKAKPNNQVAINTFTSYVEPYFRLYTEEDHAFLRERGDRATPYLIPKLGRHYTETWAEEDGTAVPVNGDSKIPPGPRGNRDDISEATIESGQVAPGPLLSRLLAAMLPEDESEEASTNGDRTPNNVGEGSHAAMLTNLEWPPNSGTTDYVDLEDRVRREMVYVGLMDPTEQPDFAAKEDDELSARLRELQTQLRQQTIVNGARKARLGELLKEQLAHQEYTQILEDLDKQVEQAFAKRSRNVKATKKKKPTVNGVGVAVARTGIGEATRALMDRRKRWTETIGPVFDSSVQGIPEESVFLNMEELEKKERERGDGDDE